jgi:hypothetical protein
MKNQMSSWLSKKETTDQPEETKEQLTEEPVVVVEDETKVEEETGEIEGDKEGFGSGKTYFKFSHLNQYLTFDVLFLKA